MELKQDSSGLHSHPSETKADRITICMYSRENKTDAEFYEQMRNERARVDRLKQGFTAAALNAGQNPPEFVISVLLVPDWENPDNSYSHPSYMEKKLQFMQAVATHFSEDFIIHDFYNEFLSDPEKDYLNHLDSGGCCLDMLKVKAIISNRDRQHLQIDSNTLIHNYPEFYNTTFARGNAVDS